MTFRQELLNTTIEHALENPIKSRGRTSSGFTTRAKGSISRMAALIVGPWDKYLGWNRYKTHPMMFKFSRDHNKICLHAEIDALIGFLDKRGADLGEYDIYVARVLKDGTPALARPCSTCLGALTYFGIRNIYHT